MGPKPLRVTEPPLVKVKLSGGFFSVLLPLALILGLSEVSKLEASKLEASKFGARTEAEADKLEFIRQIAEAATREGDEPSNAAKQAEFDKREATKQAGADIKEAAEQTTTEKKEVDQAAWNPTLDRFGSRPGV